MKRENDEITDLFRSRLSGAEITVKDGFWEELSGDLTFCHRRRRMIFFRVAAAASVLLVLAASSAAFWFFSPKEEIEEAFTKLAVSGITDLEGDRVNESFTPSVTDPISQKPVPVPHSMVACHTDMEDDDSVTVSVSFSFSVSSTTNGRDYEGQNLNPADNIWKMRSETESMSSSSEQHPASSGSMSEEKTKKRSWAVKPLIGTSLPAGKGKYKMPLLAGVTVEKMLNDYLGIESGLQYSNLRTMEEQGLHYLGIPVKLNAYLADTKKLDIYASVGGIADKCIAGASNNDFKNEPLQLAVTAGIGVNYKINERLAVFAEPGVSHYFKTDSRQETIRTKRPTNFNLICGLRMTY